MAMRGRRERWTSNKGVGLLNVTEGVAKQDIYHMDETAYFYCATPSKVMASTEQEGRKSSKKRTTVAISSNADGPARPPLLFGGTANKPR